MRGFLTIILLLGLASLAATIGGAYTVGGPGADYPDLQAALNEITDNNVTSDCVFNINPGTYDDAFYINTYQYFYQDYTITLTSATGNAEDVVLTNTNATSDDNYILTTENVDNVTFDGITFTASDATTYNRCLYITDSADNITISNCVFNGVNDTDNDNGDLIHIQNYERRFHTNCTISNNNFYGGDTHIKITGNSYNEEYINFSISNNYHDGGYCGAYVKHAVDPDIYGNYYQNVYQGLQVVEAKRAVVNGNRIFSGYYGIYFSDWNDGVNDSRIYNNVITVDGKNWNASTYTAESKGICIDDGNVVNVQHNTVLNTSLYSESRAAHITGHSVRAYNNMFVSTGGGYGMYITNFDSSVTYPNAASNNVIYSRQSNIVRYGGGYDQYYQELNDFNVASGMYNIETNPLYEDEYLHTYSPWLDNKGIIPASFVVIRDISGNIRDSVTPDIGAYEWTHDPSLTPLAGWYSVGVGQDFETLGDMAHDLVSRGMSDAVYINLADSVYDEQFELERIPGNGWDRRVVLFGGDNTIRYSGQTNAKDNYVLQTARLKYVTFVDIVFETENTSWSNLVQMQGFNRSLTFENCDFIAPVYQGSSTSRYSLSSDYYSDVADIGVHDCTFNGNAYGAIIRGDHLDIDGCDFNNHYRGAELSYADSSLVSDCDFTDCSYVGLYVNQTTMVRALGNRVTGSGRGMDFSNLAMDESETRSLIANNTIYSSNSYGLSVAGNGVDILNNTIQVEGDNHYALYFYYFPSNCDVVNNILVSRGDRAVDCYYYTPADDKVMDYNCLYSEANDLIRLQTIYYDLEDLLASNPNAHQHSIPWNPHLTPDFHSMSPYLRGAGELRNEINDDMDGDLRLGGFDIGADQQTSIYTGAPMHGLYTVGDVASDFPTLQDAVDAIELHGANGDVTFALAAGVYPGFVTMRDYPRSSNVYNLLIAGNVAVSFEVEPVGNQPGDNYAFNLRGVDNVRFYGMSFSPVNDTQRIHFFYSFGKCDNISIEYCNFDLGAQYNQGYCGGDTVGDNLLITRCNFTGGDYGVLIDGEYYNNKRNDGVIVGNCQFDGVNYPVSISKTDNLGLHDNTMTSFNKSIALSYIGGETDIYNNRIYSNGYSGSYTQGVAASLADVGATSGDDISFYNNIIYIRGGAAQAATALALHSCTRMGLNHNTIICNNDSYNEYGGAFSVSNCDSLYIMNNIFSSPVNGYPVRVSACDGCVWMGNAYYSGARDLGYVDGATYDITDLLWNQIEDFGGAFANPLPDSLGYATCSYIRGTGVLTGLSTDIDGAAWGPEPDPGATVIPNLGDVITSSAVIGQGGAYDDLANAIDQLMHRGIAGNITLYLAPGVYSPQEIGYIPNSLTGSVTICSQTEDRAIIRSNPASDADNWGVKLVNVHNITLRDIVFESQNASYARGVVLDRYNEGVDIDGCSFSTNVANPTSSNLAALYTYYAPFKDITMQNCVIDSMGYGVFLNGFTGDQQDNSNVYLLNNTITNAYQGLHLTNLTDITVDHNTFTDISGYAIDIQDAASVTVANNYVECHGSYGVTLDDIADNGEEQWIYNNYVEMSGTISAAMNLNDTPHANVVFNTLRIDTTYFNSRGFRQMAGCPDLTWVNNIVAGGEIAPVELASMDDVAQIGYNLTYCASAPFARVGGVDITDISEYQTVTGDVTTLLMAADLGEGYHTLAGSNAIDSATPFAGVEFDIEGALRATPDRGCWEHHALSLDAPQNLRIVCTGDSVVLSWDAVAGAASYNVYSATDPGLPFEQWTLVVSVSETTWSDATLASRGYYRVAASDVATDNRARR